MGNIRPVIVGLFWALTNGVQYKYNTFNLHIPLHI